MPRNNARLLRGRTKQFDLEAIKRIPIATIAKDIGIRARGFGSANCPFSDHTDAIPSFQLRSRTNTWKCYGCGRWGSAIDLLMELNGWTFVTASQWLQDKYIGRIATARSRPIVESIPTPPSPQVCVYDGPLYDWVLKNSPLQGTGRTYLLERHITETTIEEFRIGQIGNPNELLASARELFGAERLYKSGLISKYQDRYSGLVFGSGYLLFPFLSDGKCQYLQARAFGGAVGPRWKCLHGLQPTIYNIDALRNSKKVFLCEGVTDVLSAFELGKNAFALLGASAQVPPGCIEMLRGRTLHILPDNDRAGRSMAKRLSDQFSKLGIDTVVQKWPIGIKDVNEYLVSVRK